MNPTRALVRIDCVGSFRFWATMLSSSFFVMALLLVEDCLGQESPSSQESPSKRSEVAVSIERVQKDFVKHIEKQTKMQDKYRDLETQLKKSEEDLQRINAEGMRQQLAAMQATMQSMQLNAGLQILAGGQSNTNGSNNPGANQARDFAQMQLMQNRFLQNLDATLRANQLQQLDANSQAIVRKRIETVQSAVKLQQEWYVWQNELPKFYERYWPSTDPEQRWSKREIEEALAVLEQRHEEDVAAKLVAASLLERQERHSEALDLTEEVLKLESPLQAIALMQKAYLLHVSDKDKDSKQAMQAALKLDKSNPYLRWIRARLAVKQEQWPIAESESKFLTTIKPMEKEARRALALIHAARAKKSPGEGGKAVKEAQAAMELEASPGWYSHYVLAIACASARKYEEAIAAVDKAMSMVDDDDLKERCLEAKTEIEEAAGK